MSMIAHLKGNFHIIFHCKDPKINFLSNIDPHRYSPSSHHATIEIIFFFHCFHIGFLSSIVLSEYIVPNFIFSLFLFIILSCLFFSLISRYLYIYYLPSGLFVVVSWVSFVIPPEVVPGRMALLVTLFLVLTNIFNTITNVSPNVEGMTAISSWMIACMFFVFLALLEYAAILYFLLVRILIDFLFLAYIWFALIFAKY